MKKTARYHQLSAAELDRELAQAERELFQTSFQVHQNKEKRTHLPRQLRKTVARLKTLRAASVTSAPTPSTPAA